MGIKVLKAFLFTFTFTLTVLVVSHDSQAGDFYQIVINKSEQKKNTRWSLDEWLDTRDRMRMMDLWLALHSPTPYEFILGGDLNFMSESGSYSTPTSFINDSRFYLQAFASIFGLGVEHESFYGRYSGIFYLRIFGYHNQATNITLHGGVRTQSLPTSFQSGLFGASTTLYLNKIVGLEGMFRRYLVATPNLSSYQFQGNHFEGNAFADFRFLRFYGGYISQSDDAFNRTGFHGGLRVFF